MNTRPRLAATIATALTLASAAAGAAPSLAGSFGTDADYQAWLVSRGAASAPAASFVAQARSGNNANNGDYEIGLHTPPNLTSANPIGTSGQQVWGSAGMANAAVPFTLTRNAGTVSFEMGSYSAQTSLAGLADDTTLVLRLRSSTIGATSVSGLSLDGQLLGGGAWTASNGGLQILAIDGLAGNFTLTGNAALNWTSNGPFPNGSRLGLQISSFDLAPVSAVPEPGTWTMLLAGLAAIGFLARRRRG